MVTVTAVSSSTNCVDVRWSSLSSSLSLLLSPTTSYLHSFSQPQQHSIINIAPSDGSARHEWTVAVRDSATSWLRFDLEQSGIARTPMVTVKRCRVMPRLALEDERWRVEQAGSSSTAASNSSVYGLAESTPLPLIRLQAPPFSRSIIFSFFIR